MLTTGRRFGPQRALEEHAKCALSNSLLAQRVSEAYAASLVANSSGRLRLM
jgi:hypothetical protein